VIHCDFHKVSCANFIIVISPLLFMESEWAMPSIVPPRTGFAKRSRELKGPYSNRANDDDWRDGRQHEDLRPYRCDALPYENIVGSEMPESPACQT
jgi:hypothetical protein